jgi:type IV pilus assembly protein PilV
MAPGRWILIPQAGFSLLEVLVALLVFAIGLLGATALAVEGFRLEQRALVRAELALVAADLAGRMRSNRNGASSYAGPAADHGCASTLAPASVCTPDALAADDLADILARLRRVEPDARLTILPRDPAPTVIGIQWDDGEREQTYRLEVGP